MFRQKLTAFSIHFGLSLLVFISFILILRTYWYPEPFFTASGGWQGLKIVALVDLVLGPLLTFIAYNHLKTIRELRTDISIIVALQLSALVWGINTVYHQRPIAITFWENSFYTVTSADVSNQYENSPQLVKLINNPRHFYIVPKPTTIASTLAMKQTVHKRQLPEFMLINQFRSIKENFDELKYQSIDINEIISINKAMKTKLIKILEHSKTSIDENIYLPLISKYHNIVLVFSSSSQLIGFLKVPQIDSD